MSRGRPAARPDDAARRPQALDPAGTVVTHLEESGQRRAEYDFAVLPLHPAMARSLAERFAQFAGPGGTWRSVNSSRWAFDMLRRFAEFLAEQQPAPEDLPDITAAMWAAWRLATGERQSRLLKFTAGFLRGHPRLPQATRDLIMRRLPAETVTETAYTTQEFDAIKGHAARTFRSGLLRIRANVAHLQRWRAGAFEAPSPQWRLGELLDHIARTGRPPTYAAENGQQRIRYADTLVLGGSRAEVTWARLFLTPAEARALLTLMVCTYGWNAGSIAELSIPQIVSAQSGEPVVYRVELHKPRRRPPHRYESRNLTDWGAGSPGRLIVQAVEATAPGRAALGLAGTPSSRLIVWHTRDNPAAAVSIQFAGTLDQLAGNTTRGDERRVPFGQGSIEVNLRRLRKTFVLANQPDLIQHSRDTQDRVYVLPDPRTKHETRDAIELGINDAVESAHKQVHASLRRAETDPAADTATASCGDYHHSPFSEHGTACRASFLLCFSCPNAVITPRHLPRLALLHRSLDDLRAVIPAEQWARDWDLHHQRLTSIQQAPEFTAAEWDDALTAATEDDRQIIEDLLIKGGAGVSTAAHQHTYALPHPEAPVIDPEGVPSTQRHLVPRFGDRQWPIAPMSQNPSVASQNIIWDRIPTGFRESMRAAAWVMFRQALPDALVAGHNNLMVAKPSIALAFHTIAAWRNFATWADQRGIPALSDVRGADMADYVRQNVQRGLARDTVRGALVALSRLHYYGALHLPSAHRLIAPPWLTGGIDDYLPAGSGGGENNTDAISPDTIGPLLIWALRFVEDFADDILTAFAEQQQLRDATNARTAAAAGPEAFARVEAFLEDLQQRGEPIPSRSRNGGHEQTHPALFLASVTGTLISQARIVLKRPRWVAAAAADPGPCWLTTPATATIAGNPWQQGFDFYSIDALHRHLITACFVVTAYLTGMRPAEKRAELHLMKHRTPAE